MAKEKSEKNGGFPLSDAEKHYFAFISYTRSDLSAAQFVQRTLEHFRYPRDSIRKEYHPDDREYVREIFLDKTGLSGRGPLFERRLEAALACSRYLIVICSRRAAQKKSDPRERHYVEWEIQTFLKHHGNDASRIIPVILDGEPNQKGDSCLPEPLRTDEFTSRNLPDMRQQIQQTRKLGGRRSNWQSAIVTLLSYVFNVERSIIFDRFAAERAKTRAKVAIGVMAGVLIAAVLAAWGIVEQRRAADQKAERHLVEAIGIMERGAHEVFPETGLALAHLSRASRLPLANEYLMNQLMQRSWIVPVRKRPVTEKDMQSLIAKKTMERIIAPKDFPFVYRLGNGVLTAYHRIAAAKDGIGQEAWHVGEDSGDGFWGTDGIVSPIGQTLVVQRMPRDGHPNFELVAFNPFTGERMWSRDLACQAWLRDFSRDGNRLALLSPLGTVRVLNALTGESEFEAYDAGADAIDVSFNDDGNGLLIGCRGYVLECNLVKNMVEFPFKPTGYPIVAHSLSDDGKSITLEMNTGGTFGFADTYDCRTFERLARVDLTNAVVRTVPKAKETASSSGRFHVKVADKMAPNVVTLNDEHSKSSAGRRLRFPNEVKHLSFMRLGEKEYLLVLGGAGLATIKNTAFYAVVEPGTGRTICLRQGLPNQLDTVFPLGNNTMLISGINNNECRFAVLPLLEGMSAHAGFEEICHLLSGMELDEMDMPSSSVATLNDISTDGIWRRFVDYVGKDAVDRAISFISDMPFRRILDGDSQKDDDWRRTVLSAIPMQPMAWEDGWIGDLRRIVQANYAYRHPGLSRTKVEMHFARLDRDEREEALQSDPQARYYADKVTKLMLDCHPDTELPKKARAVFDNLFGE
ncbi:MAG: TIR domain-containing protein [Kiritimatiellae bacterium]|nr:TIR domain-containing protein [Kiritimatiellia bacterium]